MSAPRAVAAVDLGATSGRVMLGVIEQDTTLQGANPQDSNPQGADGHSRIELVAAHRFENRLREVDGHLSWDIDALWAEVQQGLRAAHAGAVERGLTGLSSIGIDSWAVDYGVVGPDASGPGGSRELGSGEILGEVIAYRDQRTDGIADSFAEQLSRERQYALTGIAQQPFNTLYQLVADDRTPDLPAGSTLLMVPDLLGYLLTGQRRTEVTNASSTGMLSVTEHDWCEEILTAAGVDRNLLAPLIEPGERLGTVRPQLAQDLGIGEVPVVAVGSHDTASAVLAVPAAADAFPVAYISSGTWSLIGLELQAAAPSSAALEAGFTHEGGIDGTFRFLKNVAGMWLVSESIRQWEEDGARVDLGDLLAAAAVMPANRFRIDPTDPAFLAPGRMADRVTLAARPLEGNDERPRTPAQLVRCILESLAETYRDELHAACRLARLPLPERLHVVGGGSQNALLNQLTANALGLEVVAGPVEATALGNVALQARSLGALSTRSGSLRDLVRASVRLEIYEPTDRPTRLS